MEEVHPDELLAQNQKYFEQLFGLLAFANVDRQLVHNVAYMHIRRRAIFPFSYAARCGKSS